MFAVMKDTEYATKKTFTDNFMKDWRAILGSNHVIKQFELCDFTPIFEWHLKEKEKKKQMTTEVSLFLLCKCSGVVVRFDYFISIIVCMLYDGKYFIYTLNIWLF